MLDWSEGELGRQIPAVWRLVRVAQSFDFHHALLWGIMTGEDRYAGDPIRSFAERRRKPAPRRSVEMVPGVLLEHVATEFYGEIVDSSAGVVQVRDFDGFTRSFPVSDAFLCDDERVTLIPPKRGPQRILTASGSIMGERRRAQVAKASRIFVEGRHDAELVEKVWGDDLREQAIVVEILDGIDHLDEVLTDFSPSADRRAGILVDHLVSGSKETRIAAEISRRFAPHVLILGHPFVDVWQSVKPARLGLTAWPAPPRSIEWKRGVCLALGWPAVTQQDIAEAWQFILSRVTTYRDLEASFSGQVEHLIDFVTVGHH